MEFATHPGPNVPRTSTHRLVPTRAIRPVPLSLVPRRTEVMSEQSVPGPRRTFALRTDTIRVRATTGSSSRYVPPDEHRRGLVDAADTLDTPASTTTLTTAATTIPRTQRRDISDLPDRVPAPMFSQRGSCYALI